MVKINTLNLTLKQNPLKWCYEVDKLPFVLVIISIIFVCFEITRIFFKKSIEIDDQKRDFSRIGIIAKDVVESSTEGMGLTDKEEIEIRTKLKMDILKEYLKREFRVEYDYNIDKTLWQRFIEFFKRRSNEQRNGKNKDDDSNA